MGKITSVEELKEAIQQMEAKHEVESVLLREQLKITYESLKPANLIRSTFNELVKGPGLKGGLFDSLLSASGGAIAKKITIGSTLNPLKLIPGIILQMLVTTLISKNATGIKTAAMQFLNKLKSRKATTV